MTRALIVSTIVAAFMVACAAEDAHTLGGGPGDPGGGPTGETPGAPPPADGQQPGPAPDSPQTDPAVDPGPGGCKLGAPHVGFALQDFVADRKPGELGLNRRRVKPYSALRSEFLRTLGQVPAGLPTSAAAFGEVPARWYVEPTAGAISLYTTYTLAFTTCYDTMTATAFSVAPTATSAPLECAKMQRKFWQRTATPDETQACADFTLGLTTEPVPRRQWAHACASTMTATGFTTY
jgi:hypothetical protein